MDRPAGFEPARSAEYQAAFASKIWTAAGYSKNKYKELVERRGVSASTRHKAPYADFRNVQFRRPILVSDRFFRNRSTLTTDWRLP